MKFTACPLGWQFSSILHSQIADLIHFFLFMTFLRIINELSVKLALSY